MNLRFLKKTLLELDPRLEGTVEDDSYRTALVLLAAIVCGSDTTRLTQMTELPRLFVSKIRQQMIKARLWTEIDVYYDHWYVSDGAFCAAFFWLDVLVAQGRVVRRWVEEEGQYRYWSEEHAPQRDQHGSVPII